MNEQETHANSAAERKAKIRERYKGIDRERLEVIPAVQKVNIFEEDVEQRVAVYVRVSTDDPNQTSSFELQKNHYSDVIDRHPGWKLVRIYADEGISGTSLAHRDQFIQMLKDCELGEIDIIVTKSVSRFARNVLDCIGQVRKLAALPHPVGVFFETEGIYTLGKNSEMILTILSSTAQEESHIKSEIMNASIEMRFSRGIFLTPVLLGYDLDDEGHLVINEHEAQTVRLCFFMYLFGYSTSEIAETMVKLGRKTKRGNEKWTASTVLGILQNERHCGDVLAHKTWTPNYIDHISKKNRQNVPQYREKDHHEAIISRDDFIAVQRLIMNAKYKYKGLLPHLHVVDSGLLRGFVEVNPKWSGFTAEDYYDAVRSICEESTQMNLPEQAHGQAGEFDLRGYEVARGEFFHGWRQNIVVTFSLNCIVFSKLSVRKLDSIPYVQLLFDPINQMFAVRPTTKEDRHGVNWAHVYEKSCEVKDIRASAFLPTLYEILGWKTENKYRIRGIRQQQEKEIVLLFDLHDTEVYIPVKDSDGNAQAAPFEIFDREFKPIAKTSAKLVAFPQDWASSFGREYYEHVQQPILYKGNDQAEWDSQRPGVPYKGSETLQTTPPEQLKSGIERLIKTMHQEALTNERV